jgi:hypothetical protein
VDYYFEIIYRTSKSNSKINILTRCENKIKLQNNIKTEYRIYIFFRKDQINPRVLENIGISFININLIPIKEKLEKKFRKILILLVLL